MGGFGGALSGFMRGYEQTIAQRHQQKQQDFQNLMELARSHREAMEKEQSDPAGNPTVIAAHQKAITDAMTNADKVMNQKIGGFAQLHSLISKGIENHRNAAAARLTPGQAGFDQATRAFQSGQSPAAQAPGMTAVTPPEAQAAPVSSAAAPAAPAPIPGTESAIPEMPPEFGGGSPYVSPEGAPSAAPSSAPGELPLTPRGQAATLPPDLAAAAAAPKPGMTSVTGPMNTWQKRQQAIIDQQTKAYAAMSPLEADRARKSAEAMIPAEIEKAKQVGQVQRAQALQATKDKTDALRAQPWFQSLPKSAQDRMLAQVFTGGPTPLPVIKQRKNIKNPETGQYEDWNYIQDPYTGSISRVEGSNTPSAATAGARTADAKLERAVDEEMIDGERKGTPYENRDEARKTVMANAADKTKKMAAKLNADVDSAKSLAQIRAGRATLENQKVKDMQAGGLTPQTAAAMKRSADTAVSHAMALDPEQDDDKRLAKWRELEDQEYTSMGVTRADVDAARKGKKSAAKGLTPPPGGVKPRTAVDAQGNRVEWNGTAWVQQTR